MVLFPAATENAVDGAVVSVSLFNWARIGSCPENVPVEGGREILDLEMHHSLS